MKKATLLIALALTLLFLSMDVTITLKRWEDNSARITITYCEPFGLCQE